MNLTIKSILMSCLLMFNMLIVNKYRLIAAPKVELQEMEIEFYSTKLTLKSFLDELIKHPELTIVYGSKNLKLDHEIKLSNKRLTVKRALQEVEKQAPVEFVFNNNHIIVKSRKLEKSYNLSGILRDATTKQPLASADVVIAGTTTGVVTDSYGRFSLQIAPGSYSIVFRYIGYHSKNETINLYHDVHLDILLEVKQHEIDAVDVTGSFSLIENIERGRTIETIDSKVIGRLNTNDVNDALHGRLNGVWTTKVSGAPGDHSKIRIRGISSIFGTTDPLYVVDGAIIPIVNFHNLGISDLNSNDVESITVLKDASSTALYGNLGSNGVIVIETKKGGGEQKFNFKVKQGFQTFNKRYDLMGAEDFLSTSEFADKLLVLS